MTSETLSGHIALTPRFFRQERDRLYSDPAYAIWRELITNSIDAGATEIHAGLATSAAGVTYSLIDNGEGMTKETLVNVYLTIDETSKSGGTVGGFGRARLLTCFSADRYSIRTRHASEAGGWAVAGAGIDWTVRPEAAPIGCGVAATTSTGLTEAGMSRALHAFLRRCDLPARFTLDDDTLSSASRCGEELGRLGDWATVYSGPEGPEEAIVRVNGVAMYHCHSSFPVIVEVDPTRSREVLTVNRDGLKYPYSSQFTTFISRLATEGRDAFSEELEEIDIEFEGTGRFIWEREPAKRVLSDLDTGIGTLDRVRANLRGLVTQPSTPLRAPSGLEPPLERFAENEASILADVLPNTVVKVASKNPEFRRLAEDLHPSKWQISAIANDKPVFVDKTHKGYFRLLMSWNEAIAQALAVLPNCDSLDYVTGFIVAGDTIAACDRDSSWLIRFLINPLENAKATPAELFARALHEVAHVKEGYHDSDYAKLLTHMFGAAKQSAACSAISCVSKNCV